jgi:hypothetical protein
MGSIEAALADLASQEAPNYGATAKKYDVIEVRSQDATEASPAQKQMRKALRVYSQHSSRRT